MESEQSNDPQEMRSLKPLDNKTSTSIPIKSKNIGKAQQEQQVFDLAIKDDLLWSRFLLATAIIGVLLILAAAIEVLAGNITVALAQGATGLMLDGVAILVYRPRQDARKRLDDIYSHLIEADNFEAAIRLAESLEGEARDQVTESITNRMINLSGQGIQIPEQSPGEHTNRLIKKSKKKRTSNVGTRVLNENTLTQRNSELDNMLSNTQENKPQDDNTI